MVNNLEWFENEDEKPKKRKNKNVKKMYFDFEDLPSDIENVMTVKDKDLKLKQKLSVKILEKKKIKWKKTS